jgi:alanine dehydrogenase
MCRSRTPRHEVFVQEGAGTKSGFSDDEYRRIGVTMMPTARKL